MSVYLQKDRRTYTYKFEYLGQTYKGSTHTADVDAAVAYEAALRQQVESGAADRSQLRPDEREILSYWQTFTAPERDALMTVLRLAAGVRP